MSAGLALLVPVVGVVAACAALGVSRSSYYRAGAPRAERRPRPRPVRALTETERTQVLDELNSDRFMDQAPRQVYAALLDEGRYLCSLRTMYRILSAEDEVRERRNQRRHPPYKKPELVATAPNQVWSWDITKVPGPTRGTYLSLYVLLDIFSRYVVGWALSLTESAAVAATMIEDAVRRERIQPGQLTCHSDRGSPMMAKSTTQLYADLGILASRSRPQVSDDNPYSEAAFRTFLYHPTMPERFGSLADARVFFTRLFAWYNEQHYHSGLALLTPAAVHHGRSGLIIAARQEALDAARARHPERFARAPTHPTVPAVAWINPPATAMALGGGTTP